jgi:GH15 family glucan-1,4-alpha-glucosidase
VRIDGYAPIEEYAAIGDGRTAALIARDGAIDWLCVPDLDSESVFGALLDAHRGGSFTLAPVTEFESERRYREGSNILETTFTTSTGRVRLVDGMTLADTKALAPLREVVRKVEALDGAVRLHWRIEPRLDYARRPSRLERRGDRLLTQLGGTVLAISAWGLDGWLQQDGAVAGDLELAPGETALFSLTAADGEPAVFPGREDSERRLEEADAFWRRWSAQASYEGPWQEAVVRSALALKLLVFAPSGAIAAAATASLPEEMGGQRNWDYRFSWLRDSAFVLDALEALGIAEEGHAFFWWFMHASRLTRPRLQVLYRLNGSTQAEEVELEHFEGYRKSRPVRVGNGAVDQVQLDVYGSVLDAIWTHVRNHGDLGGDTGRGVAKIADYVSEHWRDPDSSIWEVRSPPTHFVQSKAMCWVALDRATRLAAEGAIPDRSESWRAAGDEIRRFVDEQGWDAERRSYVRATDLRELDASLLTLPIMGFDGGPRLAATVDAVRRELAEGPFVRRYRGDDGVEGGEGAFLTCSFWLADALARVGQVRDATELMDELQGLANDVGLYSEEVDPDTGAFLGNFPQGLVHLALINAAVSIDAAGRAG